MSNSIFTVSLHEQWRYPRISVMPGASSGSEQRCQSMGCDDIYEHEVRSFETRMAGAGGGCRRRAARRCWMNLSGVEPAE